MNWLDIVILVIVAASTFAGLRNGLIKTVLSLAGLIVGVMLAGRYYVSLAEKLTFIPNEGIAEVVAFIIILGIVMVVAALIALLLTSIVKAVMLGWVNHLGGAVLGFILGALSCAALLTLWLKFGSASADAVKGSSLAGLVLDRFPAVLGLLPTEFDGIRSFFK